MLLFSEQDVLWAAEECERQRVGPMKVSYLLKALKFVRTDISPRKPTLIEVAQLGYMVEPDRNNDPGWTGSTVPQWRNVDVTIGGVVPLPAPQHLDRLMENLLDAWGNMKADEWYKEFEEIHPFVDGNGRVGSILWNLKRGSILNPKAPPDFWSEENKRIADEANRRTYMEISQHLFSRET